MTNILWSLNHFSFYFFGDPNSSVNYVEFLSWISTGIVTLLGLLAVFISVHYQDNLLKTKEILWELKNQKKNLQELSVALQKYEFCFEGLKLYIQAITFFRNISISLVLLWFVSTVAYLQQLTPIGSRLIVFFAFVLMTFVLWKMYYLFKDRLNKPASFDNLTDAEQFNDIYADGISILGKILKPKIIVLISKRRPSVEIIYNLPFCVYNYSISLFAKDNSHPFFYLVYKAIKSPEFKAISETLIINDISIYKKLYEYLLACSLTMFIRIGNNPGKWVTFSIDKTIEDDEDCITLIFVPKHEIEFIEVPVDVCEHITKLGEGKLEYWI